MRPREGYGHRAGRVGGHGLRPGLVSVCIPFPLLPVVSLIMILHIALVSELG